MNKQVLILALNDVAARIADDNLWEHDRIQSDINYKVCQALRAIAEELDKNDA